MVMLVMMVPFFLSGFGCRFPAFEPRFFGIVVCGLVDGDGVDASVHGLDERFWLMESAYPMLGLLRGEGSCLRRCRNRPGATSGGSVIPGAMAPGRVGSGGFRGRRGLPRDGAPWHRLTAGCPTRVFPWPVWVFILLFPFGFCGLPAERPADLSCRRWGWFAVSSGSATGRRGWRPRRWRRDCIPRRLPARASRLAWRARPPSTTVCS